MQTNDKCGIFTRTDMPFQLGRGYMGGSNSPDPADPGRRVLRAFDIQTGKPAWELPQTGPGDTFGGVLSTAGGVVFFGADDGAFAAADAKTGKRFWETFGPTTGTGQASSGTAFLVKNGDRHFLFGETGVLTIAKLSREK